jgi:hypothetical protein
MLMTSEGDARWHEMLKQTEEKQYADEQLANRNDVQSRWVNPKPDTDF